MTIAADTPPPEVDPGPFRLDPHAAFKAVRADHRAIRVSELLIATRYEDVAGLLTDPRTRQIETESVTLRGITDGGLYRFLDRVMLTSNPPAHGRRRAPTARAFAHKLITALRPTVRATAEALIDARRADGAMELRDDFAAALPARVIADILGVPAADIPEFTARVYTMSRGLGPFPIELLPDIDAAADALDAYVGDVFAARRATPGEDFLSDYVRSVDASGDLSPEEARAQVAGLILAGSDTTRTGITAMISLLLRAPDAWARVRDDPTGTADGAVREALRLEPPIGAIPRVATEAFDFAGAHVPEGGLVVGSVLSALRDEAQFADPDRFDVDRTDHPRWHLAFGLGPHRCLGEALARMEMEEALIAIAERLPGLRAAGGHPRIKGRSGIRVAERFPIAWSA